MPFGVHPAYLLVMLVLIVVIVAVVMVAVGAVRGYRTPPSLYGLRSPDGRWWWDGSRWQPLPPDQT
jgi:hypothetical protein